SVFLLPQAPRSTLFPYTTLFRSSAPNLAGQQSAARVQSTPEGSQSQQAAPSSHTGTTNVFIGYATNGSFVFPDIATSPGPLTTADRKSTRLNSSHLVISYAVFCL